MRRSTPSPCASLALLALAGCASPPPAVFPEAGAQSDAQVLQTIRARAGVASFYAVLSMGYESPEREGTFDAVMNYRAPGTFRFTAFKDLILTNYDVFDLTLDPERYAVRYTPEGADAEQVFRGPRGELAARHPRFRGFAWAAEALFLPGALSGAAEVRRPQPGVLEVDARLSSGVPVRWTLDPRTLEVQRAVLTPTPGTTLRLRYTDYVQRGARYFPHRVTFEDPAARTRIVAEPVDYEVDPPLDPSIFELDE